jgi:hypothetical protein
MSILTFIDKIFQKEPSFGSSSYKNYRSRDDFYHNLLREDTLERLILLFSNQHEALVNPSISICFRNIPFGSDERYATAKLGKARYIIDNSEKIPTHRILFYRTGLHHFRAVCQLHFLHDQFFFGKYTFRNTTPSSINNVLTVLQHKYFNDSAFQQKISSVRDQDGNALVLEKSLHLNVCYISGDASFPGFIHELVDKKRTASERRKARNMKALEDYL